MNNKYKPIPFWSWNDELEEDKLVKQIDWMHESGIGGFFMHARGGLTTPYLGEKWFSCVEACLKRAKELNMEAYAYDENGWPSGFAGGKLLVNEEDRDCYLTYSFGEYDPSSFVSYDYSTNKLVRVTKGNNVLNIFCHSAHGTADVLNKDVVKKFIKYTHEEYKKRDKYHNLRGFFTDEPQYQRWYHPYTHCLETYFKDNYNEDIKERLGLMFIEKEGYRDFRYKYWKAMQSLMLSSFAEQIYTWCDSNGYKLTGHFIEENSLTMQMECCAGIMPYYEFEHIPGIDWLGRNIGISDLSPKQVGSVCAQLGKKQILTESFAMAGWDATPQDLKRIFEWEAVLGGVSLLCHHLLPYSEYGQRKRDYPLHYSDINPWASKDFDIFNKELTSIGEKLSNSTEIVRVALLHPIRSAYFNYKRENPYEFINELNANIFTTVNKLGALHIPYHFIDETLLAKYGKVINNSIQLGLCSYDILLLPKIYTMDKTTEAIIHEYINNGGKVLLLDEKPSYLEGNEYDYYYLNSNITLEDVIKAQPFISSENENIRIAYREDDRSKKRFFYIVNTGDETSFTLNNHSLHFLKWESRFIDEVEVKDDENDDREIVRLGKQFKVVKDATNYLTLDQACYSFDNENYSEKLDCMGIQALLLNKRYNGDLYLKYEFNIKNNPSICSSLIEDQHILEVRVNGNIVKKKQTVLEQHLWEYDIAKFLVKGKNEIVVKIHYYQEDNVYFVLFDQKEMSETLLNCLVYTTTIESIYLRGNFGVFGEFTNGTKENTVLGNNFYLDSPKRSITSLIKDGFPFFRGNIELEQEFVISTNKVKLVLPERYHLLDLYINDKHVEKVMFKKEIDISKFIQIGKNKLRIIATISNRNLLGPFHLFDEEPFSVGPDTFERKGKWKNGKLDDYRESYSFVKQIVD